MKLTNIKYFVFFVLLIGIGGCDSLTSSFTDGYSENPNNPTTVPASKSFVAGQVGSVFFLEGNTARKSSMFAQYFSGEDRQYSKTFIYNTSGTDNDNIWFAAYIRGLTNIRLARQKYKQRQVVPKNQVAATKVFEAMLMGQVTSIFGDVPFSQAIQSDTTSTPPYDAQKDVYSSLNSLLDQAIQTLSNNQSTAISSDVTTLDGHPAKWLKVAYTLKARLSMETGNYSAALSAAQKGIDAKDGSGDMLMPHGSQQGRNQNLYYQFVVVQRSGYLKANESFADPYLKNSSNAKTDESARRSYYFSTTDNGRVLNTSDGGFAGQTQSFPLVTYLENKLIIAEVKARNGNIQQAIDALNNTRDYLNNKFGAGNYKHLTLADFQSGGVYSGTSVLQHTFNWEYLGFIGQIEGFNFLRRINYQIPGLKPIAGSTFPQRFVYPQSERNTNPNVPDPAPSIFDKTPVNK